MTRPVALASWVATLVVLAGAAAAFAVSWLMAPPPVRSGRGRGRRAAGRELHSRSGSREGGHAARAPGGRRRPCPATCPNGGSPATTR